jgi:hypothetical protein
MCGKTGAQVVLRLWGPSPCEENNPLKRLRNLLRQEEFQALLFILGFALLNWPFLGIFRFKRPEVLLIYLYFFWAVCIFLLCLVSRIGDESASRDDEQKRKDDGA